MPTKKERYEFFIEYFKKEMPKPETELDYDNPFQLLVAVILSAQCTDKRVNMVTPKLFEKFPSPEQLSNSTEEEVYQIIRSVTYPNSKSKNLVSMAKKLVEKFNSEIPDDADKLQELDGVGRKTANVVTSVLFNQPNMPVDTHVFRVSSRIGLTTNAKTPLEAEKQLTKHFPKDIIPIAHHWLILHGRYICIARKPKCHQCGLTTICKYYEGLEKQKDKI